MGGFSVMGMMTAARVIGLIAVAAGLSTVAAASWYDALSVVDPEITASLAAVSGDEERTQELQQDGKLNVYGKPLQKCSKRGMAMTGFTRDGRCVERQDDAGSHHICIDLTSTSENFCQATGQPNWCAQKGKCFGSPAKMCPRKNWCVCQWAFTGYIHTAGGCDKIQKVECDAVDMAALKAYEAGAAKGQVADGGKVADALACLKKKCNLK